MKSFAKQFLQRNPNLFRTLQSVRFEMHLLKVRLYNRFSPFDRARIRKLQKTGNLKLHWGCGCKHIDGWLNVDGWSTSATDLVLDLRGPLPLRDSSVSLIYTEHVLEHVDIEVGEKILREFFRVLKPGGIIRIVVPNLKSYCEAFLRNDTDWFATVDRPVESAGRGLNDIFYRHFHRYIYDFDTLRLALQSAGFPHVKRSTHRGSEQDLLRLDTDETSRIRASLYVEATK